MRTVGTCSVPGCFKPTNASVETEIGTLTRMLLELDGAISFEAQSL